MTPVVLPDAFSQLVAACCKHEMQGRVADVVLLKLSHLLHEAALGQAAEAAHSSRGPMSCEDADDAGCACLCPGRAQISHSAVCCLDDAAIRAQPGCMPWQQLRYPHQCKGPAAAADQRRDPTVQQAVTSLVLQVPPTTGNQCCSCCARFPLLQQQVPRKQSTSRRLDQVINSHALPAVVSFCCPSRLHTARPPCGRLLRCRLWQ